VVRPKKTTTIKCIFQGVCLSQDSKLVVHNVIKSTNAISSFLPIVINLVSAHGEVYSIQLHVVNFVSDLWREGDFIPI